MEGSHVGRPQLRRPARRQPGLQRRWRLFPQQLADSLCQHPVAHRQQPAGRLAGWPPHEAAKVVQIVQQRLVEPMLVRRVGNAGKMSRKNELLFLGDLLKKQVQQLIDRLEASLVIQVRRFGNLQQFVIKSPRQHLWFCSHNGSIRLVPMDTYGR